jgi:MFS family permease
MKTRLSNSFLIGEIFGMIFFGMLIDRMGRRAGVVAATFFLVLGIVLSAAAHGNTLHGYVSGGKFQEYEVPSVLLMIRVDCSGC